ncbi:MAG: tetratricopeptide repeat protein [Verrucomicrobia bacterium]|nr:MAG: tetratricopeptide repeat protein [Verrucomicrobiota bacterium]
MSCALCKRKPPKIGSEKWVGQDGTTVRIPVHEFIVASVSSPDGEFDLCEDCYKQNRFPEHIRRVMDLVHVEFGLEFLHEQRYQECIEACERALAIRQSPAAYEAEGCAFLRVGKTALATECFMNALRLQPGSAIATLNLKRIRHSEVGK